MVLILNDTQIVEGIIGATGVFLAGIAKTKLKLSSAFSTAIVGFCIVWYIRKIYMNVYAQLKKDNRIPDRKIELDIQPSILFAILILVLYLNKVNFIDALNPMTYLN